MYLDLIYHIQMQVKYDFSHILGIFMLTIKTKDQILLDKEEEQLQQIYLELLN